MTEAGLDGQEPRVPDTPYGFTAATKSAPPGRRLALQDGSGSAISMGRRSVVFLVLGQGDVDAVGQ